MTRPVGGTGGAVVRTAGRAVAVAPGLGEIEIEGDAGVGETVEVGEGEAGALRVGTAREGVAASGVAVGGGAADRTAVARAGDGVAEVVET